MEPSSLKKSYQTSFLPSATKIGLCLIFFFVFFLGFPKASAQPGFLTLNCGGEANETDGSGLLRMIDSAFTPAGLPSGPLDSGLTFRYFNDSRKKNCYRLPVLPNTTYLLRAAFEYSNFSTLFTNITFDLTLNSTYWTTVEISPVLDRNADNRGVLDTLLKEVIFHSTGSQVNLCLVRGAGLPFISTLSLRELADNMYADVKRGKLLVTQWRWAAYICCTHTTRYPEDPYDRIWTNRDDFGIITENTTLLNTSTTDVNQPPAYVMSTAWEWNRSTISVSLKNAITDLTGQYYSAAYFQEVDGSALFSSARGSRYMVVSLDGKQQQNVSDVSTLTAVTSFFDSPLTSANLSLAKQYAWSLGPSMNGWEFFSAVDVNLSTTHPSDVKGLNVVRSALGPPLRQWSGDPCFPEPWEWVTCNNAEPSSITQIRLSNMRLQGSFPTNLTGLFPQLTDLWVDNNRLTGPLPDFSSIKNLQTLHLQKNSFSGSIPETLGSLPLLNELFLQDNNFSGQIPQKLLNLDASNSSRNFTFSFDDNPFLILPGAPAAAPVPPLVPPRWNSTRNSTSSSRMDHGTNLKIWFAIGGAALMLVVVVWFVVLLYCCCQKVKSLDKGQADVLPYDQESARAFTVQEVKEMTHNFAKKIGEGSYGPVYYGKLPDGTEVAVKVNHAHSRQGTTEFINEVVLLSRVHHKYLVSLIGYCEESQQQILVYAYMHHGTLTDHLHGEVDEENFLSWRGRLDIALNSAQGLEYLQKFCNPPIIHRDVKPSNILLDINFVAKIADFGMSKSAPPGTHTGFSTAVKGTFGYLDPEYLSGWRLTEKSDVYSFGVVLLELLTGRVPTSMVHFKDGSEGNFMSWTRLAQRNGNIHAIVDPDLGSQFNTEAVWKVAELAWACTEPIGSSRPDMGEVVRGLMEAIQLENSDYVDVTSEPSFSTEFYVKPNPFKISSTTPLKASNEYSSVSTSDTYQPS